MEVWDRYHVSLTFRISNFFVAGIWFLPLATEAGIKNGAAYKKRTTCIMDVGIDKSMVATTDLLHFAIIPYIAEFGLFIVVIHHLMV